MYGVVATRRQSAGVPAWVPESALIHLDFVNGQYWDGSSEVSVLSLLGGAFNADDITASGMAVWHSNTNRPTAIGVLASIIEAGLASTGMTVIGEIDVAGEPSSGAWFSVLIGMADTTDFSTASWELNLYTGVGTGWAQITDFDVIDLFADHTASFGAGINRFGFTIGRDIGGGSYRYAATMNGEAATTDDATYTAISKFPTDGPAKITIGHIDDDATAFTGSYIRSITIYAAVDESALAVLTEVPTA